MIAFPVGGRGGVWPSRWERLYSKVWTDAYMNATGFQAVIGTQMTGCATIKNTRITGRSVSFVYSWKNLKIFVKSISRWKLSAAKNSIFVRTSICLFSAGNVLNLGGCWWNQTYLRKKWCPKPMLFMGAAILVQGRVDWKDWLLSLTQFVLFQTIVSRIHTIFVNLCVICRWGAQLFTIQKLSLS